MTELDIGLVTMWVLFSLLVGKLNHRRGGSFAVGFLSSLLVSPLIAVLVILLNPARNKKKCPACCASVPSEARVCMFCGTSMFAAGNAAQAQFVCPQCFKKFSTDANAAQEVVCSNCMAVLPLTDLRRIGPS